MALKSALRLRALKTFSGAALKTLYSDVVPPGQIQCIQKVAWEIDKTTSGGNTRCRLYVDGHGYRHYLEEQDAPAAGTLYTYAEPEWLSPGERLALEIDYAQDGVTAEMHFSGYWTETKEGIT